jgi:hypothetical protein
LIALASGSTPQRERIVVLPCDAASSPLGSAVRDIAAGSFYAALRGCVDFSGSELNLEGAVVLGDSLLLFQRGNGEARGALAALDAVASVPWQAFCAYLEGGGAGSPPPIAQVVQYELGQIDGVRLTFTDAALAPDGSVLFLACAEASPNTVDDGEVRGMALGVLDPGGAAALTWLRDEVGKLCRDKAEGIVVDPRDPETLWLSVDRDDPDVPSGLLQVRFRR